MGQGLLFTYQGPTRTSTEGGVVSRRTKEGSTGSTSHHKPPHLR